MEDWRLVGGTTCGENRPPRVVEMVVAEENCLALSIFGFRYTLDVKTQEFESPAQEGLGEARTVVWKGGRGEEQRNGVEALRGDGERRRRAEGFEGILLNLSIQLPPPNPKLIVEDEGGVIGGGVSRSL